MRVICHFTTFKAGAGSSTLPFTFGPVSWIFYSGLFFMIWGRGEENVQGKHTFLEKLHDSKEIPSGEGAFIRPLLK